MSESKANIKEISIIIPVFNVEGLLRVCIESVLRQSFTDFELILINDGSTDKSGTICQEYASRDSRIIYLNKSNGGVSSARNMGLENVSGKWVCFIDSDDFVSKDFLLHLYNHIEPNVDKQFIIGGAQYVDRFGHNLDRVIKYPEIVLKNKDCAQSFTVYDLLYIGPWSKLYNRKIVENNKIRFPPDVSYAEDLLFMTEYLYYVNHVIYSSSINYNFRVWSSTSLSNRIFSFKKEYACFVYFKNIKYKLIEHFDFKEEVKVRLIRHQTVILRRAIYGLYRSNKSTKERINILSNIIGNEYPNILCYWDKSYFFDRIGLTIIKSKNIFLFDIYMNCLFLFRKIIGGKWIKIRTLFLR